MHSKHLAWKIMFLFPQMITNFNGNLCLKFYLKSLYYCRKKFILSLMVYGIESNSLCITKLLYNSHQNIYSLIHVLVHLRKTILESISVVSIWTVEASMMCTGPVLLKLIKEERGRAEMKVRMGTGGVRGVIIH